MRPTVAVWFVWSLRFVLTEGTGVGDKNIARGSGCGGKESGGDGAITRLGRGVAGAGMLRGGGQCRGLSSSLLTFVESQLL